MVIYFIILLIVLIFPCRKGILGQENGRLRRGSIALNGSHLYVTGVLLLMVFMAGLRDYTIGIDLKHHYYTDFKRYAQQPWSDISEFGLEWGLFALSKLIGMISVEGQLYIFVTSLIPFYLTIRFFYRHSSDFKLSVALFIMYCMMYQYMNQIAQSIALSIILLGYDYLKRDKKIAFIVCIILAMSFHTTALFCALFLLIQKLRITRKTTILFTVATIAFIALYNTIFALGSILLPEYGWYIDSIKHGVGDTGLGVMIRIGLLGAAVAWALYLAIYKKDFALNQGTDFKIYMAYLAFIFQIITTQMIVMNRIGQYVLPFVLVLIPDCISSAGRYKKIVRLGIYIGMFLYFTYITVQWAEISYGVVPYKMFEA